MRVRRRVSQFLSKALEHACRTLRVHVNLRNATAPFICIFFDSVYTCMFKVPRHISSPIRARPPLEPCRRSPNACEANCVIKNAFQECAHDTISPVERLILVRAQFVDHRLDAEHEQLVAQVQPELEVVLARAVVEQSVQKRHDRRLEAHIVPVRADAPVQIVNDCLDRKQCVID